ncbi:MAG: S8 family peptidase, partial [Gemmatimonadaceae bacterium]
RLSSVQLATLRQNRNIDYVTPNQLLHTDVSQQCTPYGVGRCGWGLDRISESSLPMDGVYNMPSQAPNQGAGVHFYSIDTGANFSHNDFGGRASTAPDFVNNDLNSVDDNGHGTHTSTTMVGTVYGVAKRGLLVATKVCNAGGSCPTSAIISGVNWVTANAIHPAVANVSLGGAGTNPPLEAAVAASIASGVVYAISAGNSNSNACNFNPARVPTAITVAASGSFDGLVPPAQPDARASYSNFGTCVDLFAPGSQIIAGWIGSNSATNVISGTSMASPHVAGAAGLVLDVRPNWTVAQVTALMLAKTTNNVITNAGVGSPNKLLNVKVPSIP